MSRMPFPGRGFLLILPLGLFAGFFLPGATAADELDRFKAKNELAMQKLVGEVNFALSQARALEKTDPARARDLLRQAAAQLEDDTLLPERQRASLHNQVKTRLRDVLQLVRERQARAEQAAQKAADKLKRDLQRPDQDLPPQKGPYAVAQKTIPSTAVQMAALDKLRRDRAQAFSGVLGQVEASATPIDGVIEYPKYWQQLAENRKKIVGPKLTAQEVALLKALNSTLSVDFNGARFREVIDYLQEKTGQPIVVDEGSLKEAGADYEDPVTFKVKKVTVRTILRKILADRGLAYVLKEGTIQVVTAQRAREMMVVRAYPIDDLVGADPRFGPFLGRLQLYANVQNLISMIYGAVEPSHWQPNGGPGTITFTEAGMALVIRASAEMHYMFGGGGFGR